MAIDKKRVEKTNNLLEFFRESDLGQKALWSILYASLDKLELRILLYLFLNDASLTKKEIRGFKEIKMKYLLRDFQVIDMRVGHLTRDSKSKLGSWGILARREKQGDKNFKKIDRIVEKPMKQVVFSDLSGKRRGSIFNAIKNLKKLGIVEEAEGFVGIKISKGFREVLKKATK